MKKKSVKNTGIIRPSTLFLILLIFYALTHPFIPDILYIPLAIIMYIIANRQGWLKKLNAVDFVLMLFYLIILVILLIYLQVIAIEAIPWWKIILVGIASDVIASIFSAIPIIGDFISGLLNAFVAFMIVGGVYGLVIGLTVMFISFIPGPSPGFNTFALIVFKLITSII